MSDVVHGEVHFLYAKTNGEWRGRRNALSESYHHQFLAFSFGTEKTMDFLGTLSPLTNSMDSMDTNTFTLPSEYNFSVPKPYLEILEQPTEKFRFRYKSEMVGTHGSLSGVNSDRSRKNTFPTVQLHNYQGNAIITCALYQVKTNEGLLHAHRLVIRYGTDERDDPHEIAVNDDNKHIAVFQGMGIIHTAKKHLVDELVKKKIRLFKSKNLEPNRNTMVDIKRQSEAESKNMMLNSVCLGFNACFFNPITKSFEDICEPVYSHPINNLKSALTGELKIVRMDHTTTCCTGGQDIYILVEKVTKNNIKVRFFELDDYDNEIWSDYGKFSHIDVHHQYAIVLRAPPYKDQNIIEPVKVKIELVRPSDGARSEPRQFTYKPSLKNGRKRFRHSETLSSSELPLTLNQSFNSVGSLDAILKDPRFFDNTDNIYSDDFQEIVKMFLEDDITSEKFVTDAPVRRNKLLMNPQMEMLASKFVTDLNMLLKTKPNPEIVEKYIDKVFRDLNVDGNSVLHTAILCEQFLHLRYLLVLLSKMKHLKLANIQNDDGETALHVSVRENLSNVSEVLLSVGVDPNIIDASGNTALHLALLAQANLNEFIKLVEVTELTITNYDGYSPLHLAIIKNDLEAVKILVKAKCDVNQKYNSNGYSPLHLAVDGRSTEILQYLLYNTNAAIDIEDYNDTRPLDLAQNKLNADDPLSLEIHKIFIDFIKSRGFDTYIKTEIKEEDSDSEAEVHVKTEPSSPSIMEEDLTEDGNHLSDECIEKLAGILDNTEALQNLSKALEFNTTSTKMLLQYVNIMNIPLSTVMTALNDCGSPEAVNIVNEMLS